jgi:hypothetical protein
MSLVGREGRSFERITRQDLERLATIAAQDREAFFAAHADWAALYRDRLLLVALCQGAADHYVTGQQGVNDFDVYSFYAAHPDRHWYAKRNKSWDFGSPRFGTSSDRPEFVGRRVDLLGRGIVHHPPEDAATAVQRWLRTDRGKSARYLAQRPVICLWPQGRLGEIIWKPDLRAAAV